MNKFSFATKVALIAGLIVVLLGTSAFSFGRGSGVFGRGTGSVTTHNGTVYSYTAGSYIAIKGIGKTPFGYNITPKTVILPAELASGVAVGAQVTVVGQCYYTRNTSGCMALQIWVRLPAPSSTKR